MRSTTYVHMGIRNIGDANASPLYFEGTFNESILWMAQQLGKITMAKRIAVSIARNKDDVMTGLDLKRGGISTKQADELEAMLAQVFGSDSDDAEQDEVSSEVIEFQTDANKNPNDDYVE